MNPGKLNKRIDIITHEEFENELGQTTKGIKSFKSVRANVRSVSRSEKQAESKNDQTNYTVTIRYLKDIDTTMCIMYEGRRLEIVQIININEENKFLEIMAVYKG